MNPEPIACFMSGSILSAISGEYSFSNEDNVFFCAFSEDSSSLKPCSEDFVSLFVAFRYMEGHPLLAVL